MNDKTINYETFRTFSTIWDKFVYEPYFIEKLDAKELLALFKLSKIPTYVMCISLDNADYSNLDISCYKLYLTLCKIIKELLEDKEFLLLFAHQNCFYLNGHLSDLYRGRESSDKYKDTLKKIAEEIIRKLQKKKKTFNFSSVTIGIDSDKTTSLKKWREVSQHAIVAHRQKLFYGTGHIYLWDQSYIRHDTADNLLPSLNIFSKLLNLIVERKFTEVNYILSSLIKSIFKDNIGRLLYLRIQLMEGIILTAHTAIEMGASDIKVSEIVLDFIEKIIHFYDPVDLFSITLLSFRNLIDLIEITPVIIDPLISLVLEKIANSEDLSSLSLKKISKEIPISYSWLSRVFKKRIGISFTEYLNKEKCNRAKKLLLYTHKSISDIAISVGFSSIQYFDKIFKKVVGSSPNKFRLEQGRSFSPTNRPDKHRNI
jgi:AraC-like DNA-binding protein